MQYGVLNENNELITTSNVPCSIEGMQSVEVPDNVTCGYVLTEKGEWVKGEELIKQEKIDEFNGLKKQIIEEQNNEMIKGILEINQRKGEVSNLEELKTQITDLYNELIKTYGNEIKEQLF